MDDSGYNASMPVMKSDRREAWDWIRIDGGRGNAVGPEFLRALDAVLDELTREPDDEPARPVIVTGSRSVFSAGLDLEELAGSSRAELDEFLRRFHEIFMRLVCCPRPTVAAVNGHAVGAGFLLALACDRRVAAETLPGS
ncbi:MAG: hypothetical protein GF355_12000, partial [Candidatus Eisenbacteria bacterium]|nr:hypothetical protein [Candidatus Eisenbacteria bacterium]